MQVFFRLSEHIACLISRTYSFSRKAKPLSLVKFSEDPDLPDKECNQLLKEYMPKHTQHAKISQKLFIRSGN